MNLIVAIFIYLGLANASNPVVTQQDIQNHQAEIEETANDPDFQDFYDEACQRPGIFVMDLQDN